jgi:hypothetical protein
MIEVRFWKQNYSTQDPIIPVQCSNHRAIFNLRTRRPVHPQFNCTTHAQKARNTNLDIDNEEAVVVARAQQSRIKEVPDEDATPPPQESSKGSTSTSTST